jgi:aspartyl-tRNA(Asn)/glutamyl-tRNA(Gln) amidotransferase subunit A
MPLSPRIGGANGETAVSEELSQLAATSQVDLYRSGALSPVEVTKAALKRIEALNPKVNAFCLIAPEAALKAARESEARWRNGEPLGRVDGVPATIKDLLLSNGWPTLRGSRAVKRDQAWNEDAPAVARLREQGAIFLGKTTTPEFGWKGITDSPLTGVTPNPWGLERTAGGSSGGAGVAAALGLGTLHLGTDGGGSIRIPSSFCGVMGIKPSFGRVPLYPPSPFASLSHVGPMTFSVGDAALMLTVIAGTDPRDASALPYEPRDYLAALEAGIKGARIAFSLDLGYATVDPEVARLFRAALPSFEALGASVEEALPGFANPLEMFRTLWHAGAAQLWRLFGEQHRAVLDPGLVTVANEGLKITLADYLTNGTNRLALGAQIRQFHQRYDFLVTPTMPLPAFALRSVSGDAPLGPNGERWDDWSPFTYPFNLTGQPAATVPCGFTAQGLPVGLQIVGPPFDDVGVLRAARAFETAHPEHWKRPELKNSP